MAEPISLSAAITLLVKSAPTWLDALRSTFLDEGKKLAIEQGKNRLHKYSDEKKQLRHLELALKNAAERGLMQFQTTQERDQYRDVLAILSEPGPHNDALRREAMRLFVLVDSPHLEELKETYNRSLRIRTLAQANPPDEVDTTVYLKSFFEALITEMYMDTLFHEQMSDMLKVRTGISMQRSLTEVVATLHQIGKFIRPTYTVEQFEKDVQTYARHLERTLRYLKLAGIVPQDRGNEHIDPELNGIFVPLHLVPLNYINPVNLTSKALLPLLENALYLVVLGGPGSGKSMSIRHLAWSHTAANLSPSPILTSPLLSGDPLPLRIELRRFAEDRRQHPEYSFLSYTSEVLLPRDNVFIHTQMFQELLERRTMLLLFDGLDEVTTLEERQTLIEEIEHLAMEYPGNRILVTSRPVGYELARFSKRWFSHAWIQEFNDAQIHMFLEQWYAYVLRLAPLTSNDRQELEELYTTLKERPRLHILARNPLLLSVISALHRSKRLPDRRVLLYEECTKILLEVWSQYRGTDKRWNDLMMTEEDQRACIAYLGFVLHKRSQENEDQTSDKRIVHTNPVADDVPATYLLREIECFLESQKLFSSVVEQRAEAKRFLRLMQTEAGLIVERGTNETGEALYGFVHRTFQEYFAAMDVYERYQREEDASIISSFLGAHLYDAHWHEVILLLLGKLKRKPVTTQLLQLLEGKIQTHLSSYSGILHHDLFFISLCLTEGISVENQLAQQIILQLSHLVASSPFLSQHIEALEALISLKSTWQYAELAHNALLELLTQNILDALTKMQVAQLIYLNSPINSTEKLQATQILMQLASSSAIPFQFADEILGDLYFRYSHNSEERQTVGRMLYQLIQRPSTTFKEALSFFEGMLYAESMDVDWPKRTLLINLLLELAQSSGITFEQKVELAKVLYRYTESGSEENQLATQLLLELAQQVDLSLKEHVLAAQALYKCSFTGSNENHIAIQMLLALAQDPHISNKLVVEIAKLFYDYSSGKLEESMRITQILWKRLQQPNISFEETVLVNNAFCQITPLSSEKHQQALQRLIQLSQQSNITFEQCVLAISTFVDNSALDSQERHQALQTLVTLIQQPDLTVEQTLYLAQTIYRYSVVPVDQFVLQITFEPLVMQVLFNMAQRPNISFDQVVSVIQFLYKDENPPTFSVHQGIVIAAKTEVGHEKLKERQLARQIMVQLLQNQDLTGEQILQLAAIPLTTKVPNFADLSHSVEMILSIIQGETAREYFKKHLQMMTGKFYIDAYYEVDASDVPYLIELARQEMLPIEIRNAMFRLLRRVLPLYWKVDESRKVDNVELFDASQVENEVVKEL